MAVARKRKNGNGGTPNGSTLSKRQMKRKPINIDHLRTIEPLTDNQTKVFDAFGEGKNLILHGCAGTGKTFISLYLALRQVLDPATPYDKIYMVRSLAVSYTHLPLPTICSV